MIIKFSVYVSLPQLRLTISKVSTVVGRGVAIFSFFKKIYTFILIFREGGWEEDEPTEPHLPGLLSFPTQHFFPSFPNTRPNYLYDPYRVAAGVESCFLPLLRPSLGFLEALPSHDPCPG